MSEETKHTPGSAVITTIPSWGEIDSKRVASIQLTALEQFIYDNEPYGRESEKEFRDGLKTVVNEIKETHDDMLAALKEVIATLTDESGEAYEPADEKIVKQCDAAIAKAEGRCEMNPKEMTNEELLHEYACLDMAEGGELLRRLNEADALRKENAVIRADNADLLAKQDAFVFVHNNMASGMDTLRKENDELASALRVCKTWFQMHGMQTFNHMECGIADDALSHRMSRLAKECEAKNG